MSRPISPELHEMPSGTVMQGSPCDRDGCSWTLGKTHWWCPDAEDLFFHTRSCAIVQLRKEL
jgi:hypothetical protein